MLFTDIEGSTRLLKQLGQEYGDLLADHRQLLREAFAAHGGREMDTQGDAFFVAFARARNAVEAAVEAQRALSLHAWPEGVECRVHMGLWAKIDRDITNQAPWVPYANGVVLEVKSPRVGDYQYNPQLGTLLDQLWVR